MARRTLKVMSVFWKSSFHPCTFSLSYFAWNRRDHHRLFACSMTSCLISCMVLRRDTGVSESQSSGLTHSFKSSIACLTGVVKLSISLPWTPFCRVRHTFEQDFANWTKSCSFIILS